MQLRHLQSRDNPRFKHIARLVSSARERRAAGLIVLDGIHLIEAYLAAFGPHGVQLLMRGDAAEQREVRCLRTRIGHDDVVTVADRLFDALSPVDTPTGIMALAPMPAPSAEIDKGRFAVLLDGIQDPGNLGAILRSAAAAGSGEVHLSPACADPWSPRCLRGGMGAQFRITIRDRQSLPEVARTHPGQVVAACATGETSLFDAPLEEGCAIVIGGEGRGISSELLACATLQVRIPMAEGVESLNAASAATLLFYEWTRRHRTA